MVVPRVIGVFPFSGVGLSTSPVSLVVGPKFDIVGGQKLVFLMEVDAAGSDAEGIPGMLTYTANPGILGDVAAVTGSPASTATRFEQDISGDTDVYGAQAALLVSLHASEEPGEFRGNLTVILYASTLEVAEIDISVPPGLSAAPAVFRVGRVPSTGLTALRAALYGSGFVPNSVKWELYVRGVNDTRRPANPFVQAHGPNPSPTALGADVAPNVCSDDVTVDHVDPDEFAWLDVAVALTADVEPGPTGILHVKVGAVYG